MRYSLKYEILWVFSLITLGVGLGVMAIYIFGTPDVTNIKNFPLAQSTRLYDRSGTQELYRVFGEENRLVLTHADIPDTIRFATIAAEDANFYQHYGVDPFAILRAIKVNFANGSVKQGGSTITQQLARNLYLTQERTLNRKIKELFLAVKIEQQLTKSEILDLYLNVVPYGSNAYGIETASETFFGKNAHQLTLTESALLSALPNAPTYLSPYDTKKPLLLKRQKAILEKMFVLQFITKEELEDALSEDVFANLKPRRHNIIAPHFVVYTLKSLAERFSRVDLETAGLQITTTLDIDLQSNAETAIQNGVLRNKSHGAENAGLVALDPQSGEILAMVGSRNYFDTTIDGNVNITTSMRQPGSAFKPFAYATAFTKGLQPETLIEDKLINFGPDGSGKPYIPNNYNGRFHGILTIRQALAMSLNIPAVQTLKYAGIVDTVNLAVRMGLTTLEDPSHYGLALALGGAEVKPLDMASAFGVFGQDGIRHDNTPILHIVHGRERLDEPKNASSTRVLEADIAQKINSILSDNVSRTPIFGSKSPLGFPDGVVVAVKTGTTQDFRDGWTVGYTPNITSAVWVGNNDNRPMRNGSDGVFVAAPIWREFMNEALKRFPKTDFTPYTKTLATQATTPTVDNHPSQIIFLDKKTGREISPKKSHKNKKGNH
ncbi:MAG: transglycosylase domain-containing protein [Minisyncoccota bacterium]